MLWILTAFASEVTVSAQAGLYAPRSALRAGPVLGLSSAFSPEVASGRLRAGLQWSWATGSGEGVVEGAPWTAREHHLAGLAEVGARALPRQAPVSPELVVAVGVQRVHAVVDSPGGRMIDRSWTPVARAGPALAVDVGSGRLTLQALVQLQPPSLGASSGLALVPAATWSLVR